MGVWYLLILLIGIVFLIAGATKKGVSRSVKIVILLFVFGILIILVSLLLLLPGSSYILDELLRIR